MTAPFEWRSLQRRPDEWVARTVTALGFAFLVAAVATTRVGRADEAFVPSLWPPVFAAAAALCIAFTAWPQSDRLYAVAGAACVAAWASRPAAVVVRALDGQTIAPRTVLALVAGLVITLVLAWFWRDVVGCWQHRRYVEHAARGR